MYEKRPQDRCSRGIRHNMRGGPLNTRRSSDTSLNTVKAFNFSVFRHEIEYSLQTREHILAITQCDNTSLEISQIAAKHYRNVFLISTTSARVNELSKCININILTAIHACDIISRIADGSCIVFDNLCDISNQRFGPYIEYIIVHLSNRCEMVYTSRPFSNLSAFTIWIQAVCRFHPKVIEEPLESPPVTHFVISDDPCNPTLVRNTNLCIDSIAVEESLKKATQNLPSNETISQLIDYLISNDVGPILVVFPSKGHTKAFHEFRNDAEIAITGREEEIIKEFTNSDNKILLTTTKVAETKLIAAQTVILTSLLKFDGSRIRKMSSCEVQHIARCSGRFGVDPRGFFVSALQNCITKNEFRDMIMSDMPRVTSQFELTKNLYLKSLFSGVHDVNINSMFGTFSLINRGPLLQEQITQIAQQMPPDHITKKIMRMMDLNTAICSLCTHPLNIKDLLVNGRVVKVRSMPWSICFGGPMCGTITVAVKGISETGKAVIDREKCLVTIPIQEIVAVSDTVTPLERQQLIRIDSNEYVIHQSYKYYNGPLKVGTEKLKKYNEELETLRGELESPILAVWHQIADAITGLSLLIDRKKQLDIFHRKADIASYKKMALTVKLIPGGSRTNDELSYIVMNSDADMPFALKVALDLQFYNKFSVLDIACFICCLIKAPKAENAANDIPEDICNILRVESDFDPYTCFYQTAKKLLTQTDDIDTNTFINFVNACVLKKAKKVVKSIKNSSKQIGLTDISLKMEEVEDFIANSPYYVTFF